MSSDKSRRILGLSGVAAVCMFALADLVGSSSTPDYSPWSDAISELVQRGAVHKAWIDPLLLTYHALIIPFSHAIRTAIYLPDHHYVGPILLGAAGLAGVVLTLFLPCDPGCEPFITITGTLHIVVAIPMGFSILIAIWLISIAMRRSDDWHGLATYSSVTAIAGAMLAIVTVAVAETSYVGILERALTWSYLQWYAVIGVSIARG